MNVDHFFTIGKKHVSQRRPCEDYALTGHINPELVFGVVSDGCSGAYASTDIGARTISFAFARSVQSRKDLVGQWFRGDFFDRLGRNFLSPRITDVESDYLATLVGFVSATETASVFLMGDGAIVAKNAKGLHTLIELDWLGNTPYYLNYTLESNRRREFLERMLDPAAQPVRRRTSVFFGGDRGIEVLESETELLGFEALEYGMVFDFKPREQGLLALAVMTDGISHIGGVSTPAAAAEFMAFKNTRGGFVKRRMGKALTALGRNGHVPQDDLALACVWMGDENGG